MNWGGNIQKDTQEIHGFHVQERIEIRHIKYFDFISI